MTGNTTIPMGWINCPNAGTVVADKFVAFKTPLSSEFEKRMSKERRWNTGSVFNYLKERNIQMGLWIDLTNTERYFRKADVEKEGVKYVKLKIGGGGEVPSALAVAEFNSHCRQFLKTNPNAIIGVHCTHGFNRTGYLICSFLARVAKQNINEAFTEFCTARPPGIYRQGYVSSLWKLFSSPELPPTPSVEEPGWSQRRDRPNGNKNDAFNRSGTATKRLTSGSSAISHPKRGSISKEMNSPQFFSGVPGIEFVQDPWLRDRVLHDVRAMCGSSEVSSSYSAEFPGRRGRELGTGDLGMINSFEYSVTWIGESVKYLLLIKTAHQVFFIDSACHVFHAWSIAFPDRRNPRRIHLTDTLVDVEVMLCEYNGKLIPRYFAQDLVRLNGAPMDKLTHPQRLSLLKREIIDPRISALNNGIILRHIDTPLWLTLQQFWPVDQATQILEPRFPSETPKGLRFIPTNEDYRPQLLGSVLDWTQKREVNFGIEVNARKGRADLFVLESLTPFASTPLEPNLESCDGKIGKFSYDSVTKKWTFVEEAATTVPGSCADAVAMTAGHRSGDHVPVAALLAAIQQNLESS